MYHSQSFQMVGSAREVAIEVFSYVKSWIISLMNAFICLLCGEKNAKLIGKQRNNRQRGRYPSLVHSPSTALLSSSRNLRHLFYFLHSVRFLDERCCYSSRSFMQFDSAAPIFARVVRTLISFLKVLGFFLSGSYKIVNL